MAASSFGVLIGNLAGLHKVKPALKKPPISVKPDFKMTIDSFKQNSTVQKYVKQEKTSRRRKSPVLVLVV